MVRPLNQPDKLRLFCVATVPETHWHFLCGQLGYLQSKGFEITLVASPGQKLKDCEQRDGVRCAGISIARKIRPISDLISVCRLWYLLWREQPDIVQYSTPKAAFLCSVAAALAGIRCRIFLARGSIATANRGWLSSANAWAEWLTARLSHEVICVSASLRRFLREQRVLGETEGIVIENGMSNGIDYEKFAGNGDDGHEITKKRKQHTIGFVGRLNREKGIDDLAAVWAKIRDDFPSCRLLLVGRWDSEAAVAPQTRRMFESDPRVEVTGEMGDIRPALSRISVLCFPSHREGFPNAPMEAAAAGIPVVAFDAVGTSDAVVNERTGKLVPIGDTDGLTAALRDYLEDPVLAMSHGKAGQMRVKACYQQLPIWRGLARSYQDAARRAAVAQGWYRKLGKPTFDRFFSALALVALSPLLGVLWAVVRLRLGSPAIFTQRRPGLCGKPFLLYKFRTMTNDRDNRGNLLPDANRLTSFGRWLRSTSLDELPELWNILRGEMSFVGPRPLLMEYLQRYQGNQGHRHDVKPGLTGLAQVAGRNQLSWPKKFRLDNFYIRKHSLGLDISILWQTLGKVINRDGINGSNGITASHFRPDNEFIIFGAGGHAKVVVSILESLGKRVIGLYDENEVLRGKAIHGAQVLGGLDEFVQACTNGPGVIIAIGDNAVRQTVAEKLRHAKSRWGSVVHPSAVIDSTAVIGQGTVVCAGAIIQAGVRVGAHAIINTGAKIDHDCRVADYAHVAPGVTLAGQCSVGRAAMIGVGSTVREGSQIGEGSLVGAGAVVVSDVEPRTTVVGCPAKPRSRANEEQSLGNGGWPYFDEVEISAVAKVMRSGKVNYWTGGECLTFEKEFAEYIGVDHAIAVANGTVALELALVALGIGPGDEVIVPSRTFIATASAVVMRSARPVVADIDAQSQNITVETIKEVLTPRTKAIIAVHLAGWPCQMEEIVVFARKHKIFVVEDCAQAHGARLGGRHVGGFGDMAAFSFCQDKIITTIGEGGMLVTNNPGLWEKAWSFKDHGKDWGLSHGKGAPGEYRFLHNSFGTNWRMTEVQAAVGRKQLGRLDQWHSERTRNALYLTKLLADCPGLIMPECPDGIEHAYYRLYAFVEPEKLGPGWTRDRIIAEIQSLVGNVGCGSCGEIYREQAFASVTNQIMRPIAKRSHETSLAFLVHPGITNLHLKKVASTTKAVMWQATNSYKAHKKKAG